MLFKGTARRSAKDIADEMDAIGGQMNAYTSKDYTCYYARVLDEHTDIALDVLSDMYANPRFDEADIQKEIGVVREEISMRDDAPEDLAHDILQNAVWKGHALSYDIAGTHKAVGSFNRSVVKGYYEGRYTPDRTIISVAGNFGDDLTDKIERYFGGLERTRRNAVVSRKAVYRRAKALYEKESEQLHLCLGFEGLDYNSKDIDALSALLTFFGSGMSSRLYQRIREEHGLAYSVYSYGISSADTGLVLVYVAVNPESANKTIDLILTEIDLLRKDPITNDQLYKIKQQLKSNYLLSLENTSSRMAALGRWLLLRGEISTPDKIISRIDSITVEQFQGQAERVFDKAKMSLSAVGDVSQLTHDIVKCIP
jgi:predicted Zn-dependent peptidase